MSEYTSQAITASEKEPNEENKETDHMEITDSGGTVGESAEEPEDEAVENEEPPGLDMYPESWTHIYELD